MRLQRVFAVTLMALAGCATVPGTAPLGPPNEAAWQARRAALTQLQDWELEGRVGIVTADDGGSGSMDWKQRGDVLDFNFRGPFGAGALEVQGNAEALWVRSSRGDDFISTDPEQDFTRRLRMPLPVLSMRYWMVGLPDPNAPFAKTVDGQGQLVTLTQRGWQVDYQTYAGFGGYDLPTRLLLQRGPIRIKVAINSWHVPPLTVPGAASP